MSRLGTVFRKELIDHARDRRSMVSALLTPLMGPLLFGIMFTALASWETTERPLRIPVQGAAHGPSLISFLKRNGAEVVPAPPDYERRVRDGDEDLALVIPGDYADDFSNGRPATVELVQDSSRNKSRRPVERAQRLLRLYSSEMGALRLVARGVSPSLAAAVKVDEVDLATKQQQAANLLNMIPVFLLMAAFLGGLHVAIDTMAGERERGSLEPLVATPVSRTALVLGKWLTTVCVATLGLTATLLTFTVVIRHVPLEDLGVRATLGPREWGRILLAFLPLLLFTGALQMLIATFARSFKEAQSYVSLVTLIPMVPGFILSFSPFRTEPWMMAVPTLGQQLLTSQAMRGEPLGLAHVALAGGAAVCAAAACLATTVRLLGQERIIFGR